jgi:hypothetical protein
MALQKHALRMSTACSMIPTTTHARGAPASQLCLPLLTPLLTPHRSLLNPITAPHLQVTDVALRQLFNSAIIAQFPQYNRQPAQRRALRLH